MDEDVKTAWHFVALHDLHPGDEHPTRKGWILQYKRGERGEPMWLKPTPRWRVIAVRIILGGFLWVIGTVALINFVLDSRVY